MRPSQSPRVEPPDLDTQQTTCTEWASDRAGAGIEPEIQVQPFGNLKTALAEATRFNAYILDGRPHSSQQTIEIARAAHLIVIPTGQTKDDLRPAVKLAHNLVDCGIDRARMAFALAKTTRSAAEIAAAQAYLKQTDYTILEGFLPSQDWSADDGEGFFVQSARSRPVSDRRAMIQADHPFTGSCDGSIARSSVHRGPLIYGRTTGFLVLSSPPARSGETGAVVSLPSWIAGNILPWLPWRRRAYRRARLYLAR